MTDTKKAILLCALGFLLFSIGDAARKYVLTHGYGILEVQFWAALSATIVILFFNRNMGGFSSLWNLNNPRLHLIKSAFVSGVMFSAIVSIKYLELPLLYTIILASPLVTALLARIFFKELLSGPKIALIILGFIGVIIALHPSAQELNPGVFSALLLTFLFSANNLLSKLFPPSEPKLPFGFYPYLLTTLVCLFLTGFHPGIPALADLPLLVLAGASSTLAIVSQVKAFQLAPANVVAPYHYTQIVWGSLFSFMLFGHLPESWTIIGSTVIIFSGLALYRLDRGLKS